MSRPKQSPQCTTYEAARVEELEWEVASLRAALTAQQDYSGAEIDRLDRALIKKEQDLFKVILTVTDIASVINEALKRVCEEDRIADYIQQRTEQDLIELVQLFTLRAAQIFPDDFEDGEQS